MQTFLTIAGGVALILFGVRFLRKGLDRIFGPKLDRWVQGLVNGRLRAWLFGVGLSVLAPSSTTVSILSVQAVQAGTLSARERSFHQGRSRPTEGIEHPSGGRDHVQDPPRP